MADWKQFDFDYEPTEVERSNPSTIVNGAALAGWHTVDRMSVTANEDGSFHISGWGLDS